MRKEVFDEVRRRMFWRELLPAGAARPQIGGLKVVWIWAKYIATVFRYASTWTTRVFVDTWLAPAEVNNLGKIRARELDRAK